METIFLQWYTKQPFESTSHDIEYLQRLSLRVELVVLSRKPAKLVWKLIWEFCWFMFFSTSVFFFVVNIPQFLLCESSFWCVCVPACWVGTMPAPGAVVAHFEKLSHRHGVKLPPSVPCSVEEASLVGGGSTGRLRLCKVVVSNERSHRPLPERHHQGHWGCGERQLVHCSSPSIEPRRKRSTTQRSPFIKTQDTV